MGLKGWSSAAACAAAVTLAAYAPSTLAQGRRTPPGVAPTTLGELRAQDARVDRMLRGGDLRLREAYADPVLPGRRIERADQFHRGVRVVGGDVARQLSGGQTVSLFGTIYDGITVETQPALAEVDARRRVEARSGVRLGASRAGELVVLPLETGGHALTWRFRAFTGSDLREYFVDAHSGAIVFEYSDLQTQAAVGRATGVLGDSKKMSALQFSGSFTAEDMLRPPAIRTYDMQGNVNRVNQVLNGVIQLAQSDVASDADNTWTDGAVSDAHIYAGYTYDYFYTRFNRRGLNNNNITMRSMVHPVRRDQVFTLFNAYPEFFNNAFYAGGGYMVYGVGFPSNVTSNGKNWTFTSGALDIVAHELAHGVTDFTSNLIYFNESGALNESFSDIMAAGAEFMFQQSGDGLQRAEYLIAEDVVRGVSVTNHGIRSMANPIAYGHPDHYSVRYTGTADGGGVHINSGISNHAFYLAVEGGTNRVSGLAVQGIGGANRSQMEQVFYRAYTQLLPANATFAMARTATIQAARDLFGANSAAERSVTQAWTAVGVN